MRPGGIRIRKRSIAKLLRDVDAGRFASPHLQREFVWDGPKAAKLLDSILRAMPIGAIVICDTPRSQRLHLRQRYHVLPPFNHKFEADSAGSWGRLICDALEDEAGILFRPERHLQ